jgi:hypothetical protein
VTLEESGVEQPASTNQLENKTKTPERIGAYDGRVANESKASQTLLFAPIVGSRDGKFRS